MNNEIINLKFLGITEPKDLWGREPILKYTDFLREHLTYDITKYKIYAVAYKKIDYFYHYGLHEIPNAHESPSGGNEEVNDYFIKVPNYIAEDPFFILTTRTYESMMENFFYGYLKHDKSRSTLEHWAGIVVETYDYRSFLKIDFIIDRACLNYMIEENNLSTEDLNKIETNHLTAADMAEKLQFWQDCLDDSITSYEIRVKKL